MGVLATYPAEQAPVPPPTVTTAVAVPPLFHPDRPAATDDLGRASDAAFLADVLLHPRAATPFTLGLFGQPGSGKTTFLRQITDAVAHRSASGGDVVVVSIDAARPGAPGALLAGAVLDCLTETHPALADDLAHAGADPAEEARQAAESLNDTRRRHEAERQALDELSSRDARLVEAILEAPGSSIDAYARSHRSSIEASLRQFGFSVADPIATFKQLAREAADAPGPGSRVGLCLRALWAYKGQARLVISAAVLAVVAALVTAVADDREGWLASLRDMGERGQPVADWADAHYHWLGPIHTAALIGCLLLLATVALRAARFLRPIFKGATLLGHDLTSRRRDLKGLIAHQTRRSDGLAADVETAVRRAAEAERRAGTRGVSVHRPRRMPSDHPDATAGAVFAGLATAMAGGGATPRRVILAIDGLDERSGADAVAVLETAQRLLGPGLVCVAAAGRSHLLEGFTETDAALGFSRFERCIQLGYRIDADGTAAFSRPAYAALLAGGRVPGRSREPEPADAAALDRPWRPREAETVAALSAFAGDTPRAVKRFVNLYRIARADPHLRDAPAPVFTALALALALDNHGLFDDLDALTRASQGEAPGESTVLRRALAVAREASGEPVELGQAQRGLDVAGRYATRG